MLANSNPRHSRAHYIVLRGHIASCLIGCRCSLETFEGIAKDKIRHFSQRRGLLRLFKATAAQIAVLDEKMIAMESLTPKENAL